MANGLTTKQEAFVAAYIGDARGNATKAALSAGYPPKSAHSIGSENLQKPEIQAVIQAWRDEVKTRGIASLEYRLERLDELERLYWDVIDDRREAYAVDPSAIGGRTGLIVKQYKMIGGGDNAQLVEEYVADVGVTKEIRAIYDDAAKEMGHRVTKSESKLDGTDGFLAALRQFGGAPTP